MLEQLDERVFYLVYGGGGQGVFLGFMIVLTAIGSGWSMLALVPLFAMRRARRFAVALTAVLLATAVAVFALKALVARARPCATLSGVHALFFQAPTDYSFPSGHSAGSFAFAAFLATMLVATRGRTLGAVLASAAGVGLAAGVALSRVYLGVHFPIDVLGGALVGGAIGAIGGRAYAHRAMSPR